MKIIALIVFLVLTMFVYSQEVKVNCIVFIDGKLPRGITETYFEINGNGEKKRIDFEYTIGDLLMEKEDLDFLVSEFRDDEIDMYLTYRNYNDEIFHYNGMVRPIFFTYDWLVIRITNLNKKKGEYYFAYSTPDVIMPFRSKEYFMFEEFKP